MASHNASPLSRQHPPEKRQDKATGAGGGNEEMPGQTKTEASRRPAETDTDGNDMDSEVGGSIKDRVISFDSGNLDDDDTDRVFETWVAIPAKDFKWSVGEDDVTLKMIELIKTDGDSAETIRYAHFDEDSMTMQPGVADMEDSEFFGDLTGGSTTGSAKLNLVDFQEGEMDLDFDEVYAVRLTWRKKGEEEDGKSVSPYFSVMNGENPTKARTLQEQVLALAGASDGTEIDPSGNSRMPGDSNSASASPSSPSETDSPDSSETFETDSSSGKGDGGGGGGGLSPGVIAGIVVGVVVFLALVGGLAFFFLRRHRKAKRGAAYADAGHGAANVYMVDKVDATAQSPRSPYSDDGHEQNAPLDPHAHHDSDFHGQGPAAGQGSNGSEYAGLYQGGQQHRDGAREGGAQSSPGLQSRSNTGHYSHLVEDGMTEDDIRRLEEEERQLDAEIERAGRR